MNHRTRAAALCLAVLLPIVGQAQTPLVLPRGVTLPNGAPVDTAPAVTVNPNNGAPCFVGNTGCPGLGGTITASLGAFAPTGNLSAPLAASTTSASAALGSGDPTVLVRNTGSSDAYIVFGGPSVVATLGGTLLPAGQSVALAVTGAQSYIAAITASGTTTITATTGTGLPAITGGGGAGGSGTTMLTGSLPAYATTPTFNLGTAPSLTFSNTTFGISGSLPGFATTPTFNLGTAPSLTFTNSTFGISGSLPGYAATPTFNLGTLNGAALATNQAPITSAGTSATQAAAMQGATGGVPLPTSIANGGDIVLGNNTDAASCASGSSLLACERQQHADANSPIPAQTGDVWIGNLGGLPLAPVSSTAAESCHILQSTTAKVTFLSGYAGQAEFIYLFNSATVPADGAVTAAWVGYAGSAGTWSQPFSTPMLLSAGAVVCYSSTGPLNKTAIATNNTFSGQVR